MNTIDIPAGTRHTTPNGTVVEAVATSDSCERCIFGDCNDPEKQLGLFGYSCIDICCVPSTRKDRQSIIITRNSEGNESDTSID